ncbi:MAG: hypothetical protein J6S67_24550 [Methanobrevibacter sp.]|nr:hypothetical protein [Methanobrevibacter sp.]
MKIPQYNIIDFKEAKTELSILQEFYRVSYRRLHGHIDEDTMNDILKSIDCAIAALDFCINDCVLIEVEEHHTFAKPEDTTGLKFGD